MEVSNARNELSVTSHVTLTSALLMEFGDNGLVGLDARHGVVPVSRPACAASLSRRSMVVFHVMVLSVK
jgi:hypothetical protein